MRFLSIFFFCLFYIFSAAAQDTALQPPSPARDSATVKPPQQLTVNPQPISYDSARKYIITQLLRLNTTAPGLVLIQHPKMVLNKDWLFYYILSLLLFFGALRLTYDRYFNDLFRFFFRTSLRVNQIKEQLVQSGLQSLLFNLFFALSFGAYVYLLTVWFKNSLSISVWLIPIGATVSLMVLYAGKYVFLKFSGWVFGIGTATDTYTFIVFLINKVAGIAILPFIIVIAFAANSIASAALTISLVLVIGLFLYRFLRAYQPVQAEMKLNRFHFFIFFLAIEIAPLLLIYKLLLRIF